MGKGSNRRPEAKRGNFDKGRALIRWASDDKRGSVVRTKGYIGETPEKYKKRTFSVKNGQNKGVGSS